MSCERANRRCGSAASRNGVTGHLSRAVGAMSSWRTLNQILSGNANWSEMPNRWVDKALDSVGLGLDGKGKLYLKNVAGLIIATHALEQGTGITATLLARNAVRGKPFGQYRGILLRRNPYLANVEKARKFNYLRAPHHPSVRFKSQIKDGYYFHQGGRTWSCLTTDYQISKDTNKTLTTVKSLSLPNRGYYFDRPIDERDVVDIVLSDKDPETIPGYLGQTNEVDGILFPLREAKKALMGLNWLSMDDTERDSVELDFVDYGTLDRPRTSSYTSRYPHYASRVSPANRPSAYANLARKSLRNTPVTQGYGGIKPTTEKPVDPKSFVSDIWGNKADEDDQFKVVKTTKYSDLIDTIGGKQIAPQTIMLTDDKGRDIGQRRLQVEALDTFKDGRTMAEAYYYDEDGAHWKPIASEQALEQIATQVMDEYKKQSRLNE
ncbi:MAG: hypothetical protein AAF629_23475 [Chloroflexota bacterium]